MSKRLGVAELVKNNVVCRAIVFKVAAIGSSAPLGCLDAERGVLLMSSDGVTFAGRVNMMFHDVKVGDCVWVELSKMPVTTNYPMWHSIGYTGADRLPDAPKVVSNKVWMRPKDRTDDKVRPLLGFYNTTFAAESETEKVTK